MEFFKAQFMMHCKREFPRNDLLWILPQLSHGGFLKWGIPNSCFMGFHGKSDEHGGFEATQIYPDTSLMCF